MTDYSEPYWCDEGHPPVLCYEYCPTCAEDYFCWEEEDWENNKLFYENDLGHLEEMSQRERHPMKEKHR